MNRSSFPQTLALVLCAALLAAAGTHAQTGPAGTGGDPKWAVSVTRTPSDSWVSWPSS